MIERIGGKGFVDYEVAIHSVETRVAHMWCPFCGGWHGADPQPAISTTGEVREAPRIPGAIGRIIQTIMENETNVKFKPQAERWEESGEVDGGPALIKQEGERRRVIWDGTPNPDPYNHREIITNDGLNADYVRDINEQVIVNINRDDPYEPYRRDTSNRYTFE